MATYPKEATTAIGAHSVPTGMKRSIAEAQRDRFRPPK